MFIVRDLLVGIRIDNMALHLFDPILFQEFGETALHLAVLREMGSTLHIVDFLIQNMTAQGLNKQTNPPGPADMSGRNTALHLCALHDRRECMKLLLRSGCDHDVRNSQTRTAIDIAKEMGHEACKELVS